MNIHNTPNKSQITRTKESAQKLWVTLFVSGLLLTIGAAIGISYIQAIERYYIIAGIIGIFLFVSMFFRPELGAYLLIITVFTNLSDLFTESGLPSINQPLVATLLVVVVANLIVAPERLIPFNKISRVQWALLAYVLIAIISYTVTKDQEVALDVILRLIKNMVIFFTIFLTLNTRKKLRNAIQVLIFTIGFLVIIGVIQNLSGMEFQFFGLAKRSLIGQATAGGILRYGGPIGLSNVWGQVLVIITPFFIYRLIGTKNNSAQEFLMLGLTGVLLLAIILTGSRGAYVALLVVLPLMLIELKVRIPTIIIGLATLSILILVMPSKYTGRFTSLLTGTNESGASLNEDEAVQGRLTKMQAGLEMFKRNPFIGVGIGNYPANYWDYASDLGFEPAASNIQSEDMTRDPHSLYIEVLAETGLFGAAAFALFLFFLVKDAYKILLISKNRLDDPLWKNWMAPLFFSLVAYLVSGIFLHGVVFRWFWLIAAMTLSAIYLTEQQFRKT